MIRNTRLFRAVAKLPVLSLAFDVYFRRARRIARTRHLASLAIAVDLEGLICDARFLLRSSECEEYLDTGEALEVLGRLAQKRNGPETPEPMTLDTFRAGARSLRLNDAATPEHIRETYGGGEALTVLIYPGETHLLDLGDGAHELHIENNIYDGTREELEEILHEWAVDAHKLTEGGSE